MSDEKDPKDRSEPEAPNDAETDDTVLDEGPGGTNDISIRTYVTAWLRGGVGVRLAIIVMLLLGMGSVFVLFVYPVVFQEEQNKLVWMGVLLLFATIMLAAAIAAYKDSVDTTFFREKIEGIQEQVRENPEKTQLAWELAQTKLEAYLNRNLSQARWIFFLTVVVMIVGFALVFYGVLRTYDSPDRLPIAIVSAASGIVINFIGGSFLVIYRSTVLQSKEYVAILERINAVGMAVQIIDIIPNDSADLKNQTRAEIARQLLGMYSQVK